MFSSEMRQRKGQVVACPLGCCRWSGLSMPGLNTTAAPRLRARRTVKAGGPSLECVVLDPFVGCGGILGPDWYSVFSLFLVGCIRRITMGTWKSSLVTGLLARQGQVSIWKRSGNVSAPVFSEGFMPPPVPMVLMDCRFSRWCPCDGHRPSRGVGTLSHFSGAIPSGVRWNVFLILCVSGWSWL